MTILIIGASFAGFALGETLWNDFNIVFIDQKDHFEYLPTNLKCAVDDHWQEKILIKYEEVVEKFNNRFKYVQARLTKVNKNENTVEVELKQANGSKRKASLQYDILVIATGFKYEAPIKSNEVYTVENRRQVLSEFNKQVAEAKNIAVVGSGIVAVELAGELAFHKQAGEKKINLVARGTKLLSQLDPQAGILAEDFLKKNNVEIHYKATYDEQYKKAKGFDLVFMCTGQYYSAEFLEKEFKQSIASNGQIIVNKHFQIAYPDPKQKDSLITAKENIFVFGDACLTPIKELKNIPSLKFLVPFASQAITQYAKEEKAELKAMPDKLPIFAAVSIGPSYGIFVMNTNVIGGDGNGKGKFSFTEDYMKAYGGNEEIIKGQKMYLQQTYNDLSNKLQS